MDAPERPPAVRRQVDKVPGRDVAARSQMVQSLARAMNLLTILGESETSLSLTELARSAVLPPATAHRLLTTLQHERYVRFEAATRTWSIGVQAFVTGNGFLKTRNIVDFARPHMRRLMEAAGETVNLAVVDGGEAVYLAQVECNEMMRMLAPPGARSPLHCSGVGKAMLAALPGMKWRAMLGDRPLRRFTPATLVTHEALEQDLARIRVRGYAIDDEEHALGLRCVAAVIHDETGRPLGGLSLSGPRIRMADERIDGLGLLVKSAARTISADLGGRPPASSAA